MRISIIALLLSVFFPLGLLAQNDVKAKHDAYYLCINSIPARDKPFVDKTKEAFQNCSVYLNKYPNDDPRLIAYVTKWINAYQKINSYLNSVKVHLYPANSQSWLIYEPELKKVIPTMAEPDGNHKVEISRQFAGLKEDKYLKTAEAVYPNANQIKESLFKNWNYWAQPIGEPPSGEMMWWTGYNNGLILSTQIVSTSAVLYYLDVSKKLKANNKLPESNFTFSNTNLKYWSSIKKLEKYERSGKSFSAVYVADINLTWGQTCGGLCGHGFTRNKVVVLDQMGKVLDLFLDDKVNFSSWVS